MEKVEFPTHTMVLHGTSGVHLRVHSGTMGGRRAHCAHPRAPPDPPSRVES